ncbi:hypothetical protein SDC9_211537 [bioreactor metagenome]|uniref:Uncharacterized protein n=1 Tax=bioreactor metagenome TaxID=1076179 RepID=A0A645JJM5_9ZZZZ
MNRVGKKLLANTRLAGYEHDEVRRRNTGNGLFDLVYCRGIANDFAQGIVGIAQGEVFFLVLAAFPRHILYLAVELFCLIYTVEDCR